MNTPSPLSATMRVLRPAPHVLAFYDGRIPGRRLHSPAANWLDDGAYALGVCTYAIVAGAEALVYDTHISQPHARRIRKVLADEGVRTTRVVLSHHHKDHSAGNAVFADCEILANAATAAAMEAMREAASRADPPIDPMVMPTRVFETDMAISVGSLDVELRSFEIHSHDGLVLWLPGTRELFAGDTLKDPVTYIAEPDRLPEHLRELDRLARIEPRQILPNHGSPEVIGSGGYGPDLITATRDYVTALLRCRPEPGMASPDLQRFLAENVAASPGYYPAYEEVHRRNLNAVLGRDDSV